jgi:hypothetical protein
MRTNDIKNVLWRMVSAVIWQKRCWRLFWFIGRADERINCLEALNSKEVIANFNHFKKSFLTSKTGYLRRIKSKVIKTV